MRHLLALGILLVWPSFGLSEKTKHDTAEPPLSETNADQNVTLATMPIKNRQDAVKAIKDLGGSVEDNGEDIELDEATTDTDLSCLKWFPNVKILSLMNTQVTDAGLKHLQNLISIEALLLCNTKVTGPGLSDLQRLKNLKELSLINTPLNDAGMQHVANFKALTSLDLNNTLVTDAGLKHIAGLTHLEYLHFSDAKITDAGLAHLAGLIHLKRLYLLKTQITDTGLKHLKNLCELEVLNLRDNNISDEGVVNFGRLTKLQYLFLNGTHVTPSGAKQIVKSLPKIKSISFEEYTTIWGPDAPIEAGMPPYYIPEGPVINVGSFSKRLKEADQKTILEVTADMKKQWDRLPFEAMYVTAVRLFDLGHKDEAVYWFYSARQRAHLFNEVVAVNKVWSPPWHLCQAFRDFDFMIKGRILCHAFGDLDKWEKTVKTVLAESDKTLPQFSAIYPQFDFTPQKSWAAKNKNEIAATLESIEAVKEHAEEIKAERKKYGLDD